MMRSTHLDHNGSRLLCQIAKGAIASLNFKIIHFTGIVMANASLIISSCLLVKSTQEILDCISWFLLGSWLMKLSHLLLVTIFIGKPSRRLKVGVLQKKRQLFRDARSRHICPSMVSTHLRPWYELQPGRAYPSGYGVPVPVCVWLPYSNKDKRRRSVSWTAKQA